jgi:hypothetical protein
MVVNLAVGNIEELRIYSEITPIIALWAALLLASAIGCIAPQDQAEGYSPQGQISK